jgi:hypothetical protein
MPLTIPDAYCLFQQSFVQHFRKSMHFVLELYQLEVTSDALTSRTQNPYTFNILFALFHV